jgi:demethylmenaquinone methyltransferase/2-methoxy-6-polyprenyl-1,4-benzoquinol methylase
MADPIVIYSMFARVARRYDLANHVLSGGMDFWWRRQLVTAARKRRPRDILDLATGSGDVAFALARGLGDGSRITGMDFCQPMLDEAERKKTARIIPPSVQLTFCQGDGLALPLAEGSFDAVTISFGLRNMADRGRALSEMHRVLRPGGRLFIMEFSQPQSWFRPFYYFYMRRGAPRLAGWLTGEKSAYDYLCDSIEQFPGRAGLAREIGAAGFAGVSARGLTFGIVAIHEAVK